jgi:hypothetical protein
MVDVRPFWWAVEIGGGQRRRLVVASCGGGWEVAREFGRERGWEHLWEGGNEEKPKTKAMSFQFFFFFFLIKRPVNPSWVNQLFCGQVPQGMLLSSITL